MRVEEQQPRSGREEEHEIIDSTDEWDYAETEAAGVEDDGRRSLKWCQSHPEPGAWSEIWCCHNTGVFRSTIVQSSLLG